MRIAAAVPLILGAFLLTGCSSGSGDSAKTAAASSFAEGTCRTVAPDVLELGRDANQLGNGGEVPAKALSGLVKAQTNIRPLVEAAEPAYKPALQELVVAVGLVRLQAKVGSYTTATGDNLLKAYRSVVDVCTGESTASPSP